MSPAADRERRERGAEQRRGAEEADFELPVAQREQVGGQQHGDEAVRERAQCTRRQQQSNHLLIDP